MKAVLRLNVIPISFFFIVIVHRVECFKNSIVVRLNIFLVIWKISRMTKFITDVCLVKICETRGFP